MIFATLAMARRAGGGGVYGRRVGSAASLAQRCWARLGSGGRPEETYDNDSAAESSWRVCVCVLGSSSPAFETGNKQRGAGDWRAGLASQGEPPQRGGKGRGSKARQVKRNEAKRSEQTWAKRACHSSKLGCCWWCVCVCFFFRGGGPARSAALIRRPIGHARKQRMWRGGEEESGEGRKWPPTAKRERSQCCGRLCTERVVV